MAVTVDVYAPFDSGPGASVMEDTWRKIMRNPTVSGVLRNVLNELQVYADSTGLQVKVKTGEIWLEGHWGTIQSEKTLPIETPHATLARIDRVVARVDFVNNRIELGVTAGTAAATPTAPGITRNTSIFEVSLATVSVPAADTSIDAGQVTDARMFGGVPYSAVTDDQFFYSEKMSSTTRGSCTAAAALASGNAYVERVVSQVQNVVSTVMVHVITAQVGGSASYWVYKGFTQRDLAQVATGSITLTGSADATKTATFTPVTIEAGMQVAIAVRTTGTTTDPTIASTPNVVSAAFTNPTSPATAKTSVFKAATPGTAIDLLDGSWSNSQVFRWMALR